MNVLKNVLIKQLYGQIQAKNAYSIVLNRKNIHMKMKIVSIDVTQIRYGKTNSVYHIVRKKSIILM